MAKKKYYAVQVGRIPGIYGTWDECKAQTEGVSGAKHKTFSSLEEAERYVRGANDDALDAESTTPLSKDDLNSQVEKAVAALAENEIIAFVDGSYDVTQEKSAFGAIIFSHGSNRDILYKAFTKQLGEEFISLRNVAAELEAVKESINWAIQYGKSKISIYYDYEGIEKWADGKKSVRFYKLNSQKYPHIQVFNLTKKLMLLLKMHCLPKDTRLIMMDLYIL